MSKDKVCMLLMLCLSFIVVFGGWFLTKGILNSKADEILSVKGQVIIGNTKTDEGKENSVVREEFVPQSLPEEKMAEVLSVWEAGGREILHEPKAGQADMEQAVDIGKDWITGMAEHGIVPMECKFDKVNARLCSLDVQVDFDESLLSFWAIQYVENDVEVNLIIHASSGEVWKASLSMKEGDCLLKEYSSEELLKIVFPSVDKGNTAATNLINDTNYVIMQKGLVYAAVKEQKISVVSMNKKQEAVIVIDFLLGTV